ncbi:hypothetical protein [Salsuginibacillus kocurii]|uniref:hypothetical protein n=1 Tax=Salsuginibacillus kocurii TaxID=427078 RepID=UPI00037CAFAF|nr:hypothetical protein [Salsuginibacillus kocurii]
MDRSQQLDDMRLEVGRTLDVAQSLKDFYDKIAEIFGACYLKRGSVSVYRHTHGEFQRLSQFGACPFKEIETYQHLPFKMCAIRGELTVYYSLHTHSVLVPFFSQAFLQGVLALHIPRQSFEFDEEDATFLKEVTRFVSNNVHQFTY